MRRLAERPTHTPEPGTQLLLPGQAVETVSVGGMQLQLVASGDGTEIIRHILEPGRLWGLRPETGWGALECITLLSGTLTWLRDAGNITLYPGTTVAANPVQTECVFRAETTVELLYICSRPVFQAYSHELEELINLAVAVEVKDGYTRAHCGRIRSMALAVGQQLGLSTQRLHVLDYGAFFHDLGKTGVPAEILSKPGALTPSEWEVIRRHPSLGREMIGTTYMQDAGPVIEQHHERYDGSGYPHRLRGDEICLEAHIVGVVDSYDAMTTDRVYRRGMDPHVALAEIQRCAGTLYRPDVVEAFLDWIHDCDAEREVKACVQGQS